MSKRLHAVHVALWMDIEKLGRKDSNLRMAGPKPAALPLGDAPIIKSYYNNNPKPVPVKLKPESVPECYLRLGDLEPRDTWRDPERPMLYLCVNKGSSS
jgi:hypothetical protein